MSKPVNSIDDPFFIVYDSRSGSTFLANLLVKFAGAAIPPESNFITGLLSKYPKHTIDHSFDLEKAIEVVYEDSKFRDWNLSQSEIEHYIQKNFPIEVRDFVLQICTLYRNKYYPNSQAFGLKKGVYLDRHKEMKMMFPSSRFIGILRDGRAVFNSKKHSIYSVTGQAFETNARSAAEEWCRIYGLLRKVDQKYPNEVVTIRYEDMIREPGGIVSTLCNFLHIPQLSECSEKQQSYAIPARYGDLHLNVNKEPLVERATAWRKSLSDEEVYVFESCAYRQLLAAGYPVVNTRMRLRSNQIIEKCRSFLSLG
ncbi:hypothetical protein C1752_01218 [Acaryochloris thomasi RCC1774]|uniref:Sulfotransferase n=1 Tax=Acaryochloris thomasi RCC1774 TaxID=1764569 RepID=A0A2W1JUS5_9CYAN|nr:sulfotransferase [Acaryochloris thomasi]PZD74232.1 hypothetical protein C1752_01218 [Acaryochloris thomasi RCC1774]